MIKRRIGSAGTIKIVDKAKEEAEKNGFPEKIIVTVGNLSSEKEPKIMQNNINEELNRRLPQYRVRSENDLLFTAGFIEVELIKV